MSHEVSHSSVRGELSLAHQMRQIPCIAVLESTVPHGLHPGAPAQPVAPIVTMSWRPSINQALPELLAISQDGKSAP